VGWATRSAVGQSGIDLVRDVGCHIAASAFNRIAFQNLDRARDRRLFFARWLLAKSESIVASKCNHPLVVQAFWPFLVGEISSRA
jgi:hypothetical protein